MITSTISKFYIALKYRRLHSGRVAIATTYWTGKFKIISVELGNQQLDPTQQAQRNVWEKSYKRLQAVHSQQLPEVVQTVQNTLRVILNTIDQVNNLTKHATFSFYDKAFNSDVNFSVHN